MPKSHETNSRKTDNIGYGGVKRRQRNQDCFEGKITFRESFKEMMDSIATPYPACIDLLVKTIKLDPYFTKWLEYARAHNIPTIVLSSGMAPIIEALLKNLVGEELSKDIQVIANTVRARPGKTLEDESGWEMVFHDESGFGHDKSRAIRPYSSLPEGERPTLFYAGDGVSDFSAARETDLLFAKRGKDLVNWCVKEDIPFTVFDDWETIVSGVQRIVLVFTEVSLCFIYVLTM
jgi:2,3-diketo-5-methylthio-1-phosphopentane phosphatase